MPALLRALRLAQRGPASESLQGRNPREIGQGSAASAMEISTLLSHCWNRGFAARSGPPGRQHCAEAPQSRPSLGPHGPPQLGYGHFIFPGQTLPSPDDGRRRWAA